MKHVTDSSGTRWEVAFIGGSAVGARGGRDAFLEAPTDTIVFTAPDGQKVDRTAITGMFAGMTNAELVRLLEETPEDQGSWRIRDPSAGSRPAEVGAPAGRGNKDFERVNPPHLRKAIKENVWMNDRKEAQDTLSGPDAERLEIEGDREERLAEALRKTRPKEGWPKPEKQPKPNND